MDSPQQRKIRFLNQVARYKLDENENRELIAALQDYQHNRTIDQFLKRLIIILKPSGKLELMKDIRNIVHRQHLAKFDWLLNSYVRNRTFTAPHVIADRPIPGEKHYRARTAPIILSKGQSPRENNLSSNRIRRIRDLKNDGNFTLPNKTSVRPSGGKFKVVNFLQPDQFQNLGFSICGGKENGCGIFVGHVQSNGYAETRGLGVGDMFIEVNGISLEHVALHSALKLLKNLKQLKFVVKTNSRPTSVSHLVAINPWTNGRLHHTQRVSPVSSISRNSKLVSPTPTIQTGILEFCSIPEKHLELKLDTTHHGWSIGFNVRGGSEYGLGIFTSSVDAGSPAERSGLKPGDLILNVNGKSFQTITHHDAIDFIKNQTKLSLTVKSVGKIPEGRQLVHEYSWVTTDGERVTSRLGTFEEEVITAANLRRSTSENSLYLNTFNGITDIPVDVPRQSMSSLDVATQISSEILEEREYSPTPELLDRSMSSLDVGTQISTEIIKDRKDSYAPSPIEKAYTDVNFSIPMRKASTPAREDSANGNISTPISKHSTKDKNKHQRNMERRLSLDSNIKITIGDEKANVLCDQPPNQKSKKKHDSDYHLTLNYQGKSSSLSNLSDLDTSLRQKGLGKKTFGSVDMLNSKGSQSFFRRQGGRILNALSGKKKKEKNSSNRDLFNSALFDDPEEKIRILDEKLQETLTVNQYKVVKNHIADYLGKGDVEIFAIHILAAFDTPQKYTLITYVRNIIFPYEVGRFDAIVAKHEVQNIHKNNNSTNQQVTQCSLTPVIYNKHKKPPKKSLVAAVKSPSTGKFKLKSEEELIKNHINKEDQEKVYHHALSVVDRDSTLDMYDSVSNMPQPSLMYASMLQRNQPETFTVRSGDNRVERSNSMDFTSFIHDSEVSSTESGVVPHRINVVGESKVKNRKNKSRVKNTPIEVKVVDKNNYRSKPRSKNYEERYKKVSTFRDVLPMKNNDKNVHNIKSDNRRKNNHQYDNEEGLKHPVIYSPTPRNVILKLEAPGNVYEDQNANNNSLNKSNTYDMNGIILSGIGHDSNDDDDVDKSDNFSNDDIIFDDDDDEDDDAIISDLVNNKRYTNVFNTNSINKANGIEPELEKKLSNHDSDLLFSDDENNNENGSAIPKDFYAVIDKTYQEKMPVKKVKALQVQDSFSSYDVSTSVSHTNKTGNNNNIIIKNVKINKPNKSVYEFFPEAAEHNSLRQNSAFSSGKSSEVSTLSDNTSVKNHADLFASVEDLSKQMYKDGSNDEHFHEIQLEKHHKMLGLSICGGSDVPKQPDIKIFTVHQNSAASQTGIKSGQILISIDGESLVDTSHKEAVDLVRAAYNDKSSPILRLVVADH